MDRCGTRGQSGPAEVALGCLTYNSHTTNTYCARDGKAGDAMAMLLPASTSVPRPWPEQAGGSPQAGTKDWWGRRRGVAQCLAQGIISPLWHRCHVPGLCHQWTCWGGICPFTPVIDDKLNTLAPVLNPGDSTSERPPMEPVPLIPSGISSQFSIHPTVHSCWVCEWGCCETVSEPCWSWGRQHPLLFPRPSRWSFHHRNNQVGQAWLTCSESMLAAGDHLLVPQLNRDGLQNEGLHPLTWDWDKADWPALPWVLLALSEDWSDFWCLAVLRHLSSDSTWNITQCSWRLGQVLCNHSVFYWLSMPVCKWGQQDVYCMVEWFIWSKDVWSLNEDINDVTKK